MSRRLLLTLIAIELFAGGWLLAQRLRRPSAPPLNLTRLPPATAAALEDLRRRANLDRTGAWLELGEACLGYGYLPEAEVCLARAVAVTPDDSSALWAHARSLQRLGRLDDAITAFEAAARRSDFAREMRCRLEIGKCHLRAERPEEAERVLSAIERLPLARLELTRLLLADGRLEKAAVHLAELRKSPQLDIETEMLAVELARLRGDPLETVLAEERSERATSETEARREWLDLEEFRSRYGLQSALEQASASGDPRAPTPDRAAATVRFQQIIDSNPPEVMEHFLVPAARIAYASGDADSGLRWLAQFEKRVVPPPLALHYAGLACADANRLEEARDLLVQANRRSPIEESVSRLVEIQRAAGRMSEASSLEADAAWLKGIESYLDGNLEDAYTALTRAANLRPADPRAWFALGELAVASGDLNRAAAAYRHAIEANPRFGRARERLSALSPDSTPSR